MSEVAFDELLRRLSDAGVRFVLVGGMAVNAWGVVRGTRDVDIVSATDAPNLQRLAEVVVAAGGRVQTSETLAGSVFSIAALLGSGGRVSIDTRLGALDVVHGLPAVPSFVELEARAVGVTIAGAVVKVCSLEDLCAMKRAAGRTRDLADLEDLEAALGEE